MLNIFSNILLVVNSTANKNNSIARIDVFNIEDKIPDDVEHMSFKGINSTKLNHFFTKLKVFNKNLKTLEFIDCDLNNNVLKTINSCHQAAKSIKIHFSNCNASKLQLHLLGSNFEISADDKSTQKAGASREIEMLGEMFNTLLSGADQGNRGNKMSPEMEFIHNNIKLLGDSTRSQFMEVFQSYIGKRQDPNKDDGRNIDRLKIVPKLPTFKIPVLLLKNNPNIDALREQYRNLLLKIANYLMVGYDKQKNYIVDILINSISENSAGKHNRFPKDPICFIGQPGLGKTLFAKVIAAMLSSFELIEEYNECGTIMWDNQEAKLKNGLFPESVINNIAKTCSEENQWKNYLGTIKLQEQKDEKSLHGFSGTYANAEVGAIVNALTKGGFDYGPNGDPSSLSKEQKKRAYKPNGTMRKRPFIVLHFDEPDKFKSIYKESLLTLLLNVVDDSRDNYMDNFLKIPLDLTNIFILLTGNEDKNFPGPFKDRLDIIPITGFSKKEKQELVKELLSGRYQVEFDPIFLTSKKVKVEEDAIELIVKWFGADKLGVRRLQRAVNEVISNAIRRHNTTKVSIVITSKNLIDFVDENSLANISYEQNTENKKAGTYNVFLRNPSNEYTANEIMVAPVQLTPQMQKFAAVTRLGEEGARSKHEIESEFNTTMQASLESIVNMMGPSAQFIKSKIATSNYVFHFVNPISAEEMTNVRLFTILALWSKLVNQSIKKTIVPIASCTIQGDLASIDDVLGRIKLELYRNPTVKIFIISKVDQNIESTIIKFLKDEGKGSIQIKCLDTVAEVINIVFDN